MSLLSEYSDAFRGIKAWHKKESFELTRRAMAVVVEQGILPDEGSIPMPVFWDRGFDIAVRQYHYLKIKVRGKYTPHNISTKVISNSAGNYLSAFTGHIEKLKKGKLDIIASKLTPPQFIQDRYQDYSIPAWLKQYTKDESSAQRIAAKIQADLLDNSLGSSLIHTPEEYNHMCNDRLSCMGVSSSSHSSIFKTFMWTKFNLWPSLFFYYCPFIQGACLKDKQSGGTLARGTINLDSGSKSLYSNGTSYRMKVDADLENYRKENRIATTDFTIPAIEMYYKDNKEPYYICPLAYHDVMSDRHYYIYFDKKKKEFVFTFTQNLKFKCTRIYDNTYNYKGWIYARQTDDVIRSCADYLSTKGIENVKLPY